jgi:hypothetical protein
MRLGIEGTTTGTVTLILHCNGTNWAKVKSPNHSSTVRNFLSDVSIDSPSDALGRRGVLPLFRVHRPTTLILHWNGTAWTQS